MDISTLNSHYERLQQLSKNEGTLDGLKSGAANCTGLFATEIAELEAQIEQEKAVIAESEEIIAAWISGIEDGTTRTIMTIEELNVLFDLRAELEWLNTAKAQLMDAATSTTAKLTGMPHGSGVTDKVGGFAAEIADLDSQIEQITAKSDAKEAQLADWIAGIRDPRTRLVFRLRFFRALSWKEIAKITHTTTDTVKAIVYRYLREETRSTHGAKEGA